LDSPLILCFFIWFVPAFPLYCVSIFFFFFFLPIFPPLFPEPVRTYGFFSDLGSTPGHSPFSFWSFVVSHVVLAASFLFLTLGSVEISHFISAFFVFSFPPPSYFLEKENPQPWSFSFVPKFYFTILRISFFLIFFFGAPRTLVFSPILPPLGFNLFFSSLGTPGSSTFLQVLPPRFFFHIAVDVFQPLL